MLRDKMSDYSFRNSGSGRQSSLSVQGESMGRDTSNGSVKKNYRYRVISNDSSVDETLFGSHRERNRKAQVEWSDHPPQRAPSSGTTRKSPAIKPMLTVSPSMPKTRNKYRIQQHTPTYVDHSLFGGPLEEPSFEAPWTDKKADKRRKTPLLWGSPVQGSLEFESRSNSTMGERPMSSSGSRPGSATGGRRSSTGSRPQSASGRRSATPSKPAPWK